MNMFNKIPISKPSLNKFDLSHSRKFSCRMGELIPVMVKEVLPGERYRKSSHCFTRLAPMIFPVMHDVSITIEDWFVPYRLVWDEWEDFITGGRLGTSEPVMPFMLASDVNLTALSRSTLADHLGIPPISSTTDLEVPINVLAFRAYQKIWNENYRDQNLTADLDISTASGIMNPGAELTKITTLRNVCWGKEYLSSALPFAQRGGEVDIPIEVMVDTATMKVGGGLADNGNMIIGTPGVGGNNLFDDMANEIELTGDSAGVSVNQLREAFAIQIWLEKNARGGARYKEQLLSHWGVVSSDARLQRPEYLGGGIQPVVMSEVLQTAPAAADASSVGQMKGHGVSVGSSARYHRYFEEHGVVLSLMFVRPRSGYENGIPRHFRRANKFDFAWRELANLGEQSILNSEVWYNGFAAQSGDPNGTWGYIPRYSEYKYMPNTVHGAFRDTLSGFHMNKIYTQLPPLNEEFVKCVPTKRIFAVEDPGEEDLYVHVMHDIDALIPLPYYGVPSSLGGGS